MKLYIESFVLQKGRLKYSLASEVVFKSFLFTFFSNDRRNQNGMELDVCFQ